MSASTTLDQKENSSTKRREKEKWRAIFGLKTIFIKTFIQHDNFTMMTNNVETMMTKMMFTMMIPKKLMLPKKLMKERE